uniref:Uncharacterized protein n=1 Tax=Glossina austeni TaxID=7395 RepID=A0A1A9VMA4_GLOAU
MLRYKKRDQQDIGKILYFTGPVWKKDGEDLSVLEFEYNIEGKDQTDNLEGIENTDTAREKHSEEKGEDGASISNAVFTQFMQQMQQQMQQKTYQQTQQIQSKIDGTTEKIEKVQDNQRILQTYIDETYQQFEGKVNVQEEKVDNAIGQLDAKIKALRKEVAKLQTNDNTQFLANILYCVIIRLPSMNMNIYLGNIINDDTFSAR